MLKTAERGPYKAMLTTANQSVSAATSWLTYIHRTFSGYKRSLRLGRAEEFGTHFFVQFAVQFMNHSFA